MNKRIFFSPITLADIGGVGGSENFAGLGMNVDWAPHEDVLTWPELDATPTAFADLATIADDIVFKTGKCFKKLYITAETGMLDSNMIGQRDSMAFSNVLKCNNPGNDAAVLGFLTHMANRPGVYIVTELDGRKRLLGTSLRGADIKGNVKGGGKIEDGKFTEFTIEVNGRIAPVYTGAISYTPAV
jgi:hypothetical protein